MSINTKPKYNHGYVDVRGADNKLLFRYDPYRRLIQIQRNGRHTRQVVDLQEYDDLLFLNLDGPEAEESEGP